MNNVSEKYTFDVCMAKVQILSGQPYVVVVSEFLQLCDATHLICILLEDFFFKQYNRNSYICYSVVNLYVALQNLLLSYAWKDANFNGLLHERRGIKFYSSYLCFHQIV